MYNIRFKSWDEFKTKVIKSIVDSNEYASTDGFLFRGQAESGWPLVSSFDRIEKDKSKYELLLKCFVDTCRNYGYNSDLFEKEDKDLVAAHAQHYGLPTRLLDWTESPYVAAFFALSTFRSNGNANRNCAIWAINRNSKLLKKSGGLEFITLATNKYNARMANQRGHFTLSKHTEDSIDEFESTILRKHSIDDLLWKFEIPVSFQKEALADLELMGITFGKTYPDITGYVAEAIYLSQLGQS